MVESSFPIVSFAPFLSGSEDGQRKVASGLYNAFHTYGWVYLKDFGISQEEIDEMFAVSKKYFERPLEEKLKQTLSSAETNQGYTPDGAEANGGTDHKECYEHRRFKNELCQTEEEMKGFREFLDEFYQVSTSFRRDEVCGKAHVQLSNMTSSSSFDQKCYKLSVAVLTSLALTLGLPKDYFVDALENADPQLRLLRYMPIHRSEIEAEGHARIIPHTDFGLCTILFQDQVGGLEVDPFHTGKFLPATPMRGTCVINVADLLQRLSNGRLRPTLHRVTTPQLTKEKSESIGENGMLPARYSTAFFVHPSADVEIVPILGEGETMSKYEKVNAGQWRTYNTAKNYSNLLQASA